jgi:RNA polymerase sigma-70 factor (ECF subfamily)
MTGSYHDAEDMVQETYLRARRGIGRFEQRSSLSTWLYRIATNACLTALSGRRRRVLPSGLGAPTDDPDAPSVLDLSTSWLQPLPDDLSLRSLSADPADLAIHRESVHLAVIAMLQHLPPRQRAVFLLRQVLGFPADEVARSLRITVPAVKSLLQRARRRIDVAAPSRARIDSTTVESQLLERYIAAFETSDVDGIRQLADDDFSIEAPPSQTWFQGVATCLPYLERYVLGAPGDWRMFPIRVNGQPAAVSYLRDASHQYRASGLCVLTVSGETIKKATVFKDPWLVAAIGYPPTLDG